MIIKDANFDICLNDDNEPYFESSEVNLDKDTLVFPIFYNGTTGTIEFHRNHVVINPANGESKQLSALAFTQLLEVVGD